MGKFLQTIIIDCKAQAVGKEGFAFGGIPRARFIISYYIELNKIITVNLLKPINSFELRIRTKTLVLTKKNEIVA